MDEDVTRRRNEDLQQPMKRNAVTYDLGKETEETNTLELKLNTHVAGDFRGLDYRGYEARGVCQCTKALVLRPYNIETELAL